MKVIKVLLICLFAITGACTKTGVLPTKDPLEVISVIWPLKPGNNWHFRINTFDNSGSILTTNSLIDSVTQKMQLHCKMYGYQMKETVNDTNVFTYGCYNNMEGFWVENDYSISSILLLYKYEGIAGQSYDNLNYNLKIMSINDTITVPAGTFICYKYYVTSSYNYSIYEYDWLCPDIGLIRKDKVEKFYGIETVTQRQELISYYLN